MSVAIASIYALIVQKFDDRKKLVYTVGAPMGSSCPVVSGGTVVITERDFPAVWNK